MDENKYPMLKKYLDFKNNIKNNNNDDYSNLFNNIFNLFNEK